MTLKYESEILFDLMKRDGDDNPSDVLPYESELKEKYINQIVGAYPKVQDYRAEWLNYNLYGKIPSDFPYEYAANVTSASFNNVVPYAYKSAILKGCTGYRDIDTGEILETFEEGINLELVSVKMPVLTTSNEDGTKTNILSVNQDVELRGISDVQDTLDLLTGEIVQNIGEIVIDGTQNGVYDYVTNEQLGLLTIRLPKIPNIKNDGVNLFGLLSNKYNSVTNKSPNNIYAYNGRIMMTKSLSELELFNTSDKIKLFLSQNPITLQYPLATPVIKTVDLRCINEQGESVTFRPIEGTMHVNTSSQTLPPLLDMSVPVEATSQNLMSFANIGEEE